jgi:hypothetical protein
MQLKTTSFAFACALLIGSGTALAAGATPTAKPMTAQQQRMVDCNHQATGKTGDERKTFMSACLKGASSAAPAATSQQQKMKSCSADAKAKSLKGDARKTYMSTCLKGDTASAATPAAMPAATTTASAGTTQQEKMKTCSADAKAKALKGAARKSYMSSCLKGEGASAH